VALPNVAEDFTGKAPDLGAFEHGAPVPHFGPRSPQQKKATDRYWILRSQRPD